MTGHKTECLKKETEILRKEDKIKTELAEIVPMIRDLPPEAIDDELVEAVQQACRNARDRADKAKFASKTLPRKPPSARSSAPPAAETA